MSAIAAIHIRNGGPDPSLVEGMLAAAPHRGSQRIVETMGSAGLGITRDPEWIRADLFRSHRHLVAFAGRLDNAPDLRRALRTPAPPHADGPDGAALVAAAFEEWGPLGVARFRGSFAGFVTDGISLWCFRDHFGSRPLFYHQHGDRFVGATEVKQVLAGAGIPREPDLEHLHAVLFGGFNVSTAFKGVRRIPKRSVGHVDGGGGAIRLQEHWNPAERVATARMGLDEAVEGTRQALETAVRRVLTGQDVILLSGGLDSPALAAFAVEALQKGEPIQAATAVYPAFPSVDESEWTRMVAEHLGLPLHEFVPEAGSLDDLEDWIDLLDGPVDRISIPEAAEAYRVARALGGRTVLTGEIAEMVFQSRGYLLDYLVARGRVRSAVKVLGGPRQALRNPVWLARQVVRIFAPPSWVMAYHRRKPRSFRGVPSWLDPERLRAPIGHVPFDQLPPRERWVRMQTAWSIGPGAMFEADEICAASLGVECRRPFADVDLCEFVLSLRGEVKFATARSKPLLRAAMRGLLPDSLIDRRDKTVFDEFHLAKADYPRLLSLLRKTGHRLDGVDYGMLETRIQEEAMPAWELQWARDLARIHAFLAQ